ncbi:tRNA (adenine(22)-N(1))-methyltransferase [Sutcliffiella cohnii]
MNELKLSKRLEEVVKHIPKGSSIADIGSDHAYLPCYAYLTEQIKSAIAGEVVEGPYQSALDQVKKSKLQHVITVRKGDGLDVISPGEVDCITIAGMGGTLIQSILERGKNKLEGVKRLILQPNIGTHKVREWLLQNDWEIITETILEEDQRIYEIVVAERGTAIAPYHENKEAGLLLGPFLMKEKSEVFKKKWQHEKLHWQQIVTQLQNAPESEENRKKKVELQQKIAIVEEIL